MSWREAVPAAAPKRLDARFRAPIDLEHLRQQTLGNEDLQKQVLRIFLRQSAECIQRIKAAPDMAERSAAAHALVGAARGVGAFSVAYIACEIELAKAAVTGRLIALERAHERARDFIVDFLKE